MKKEVIRESSDKWHKKRIFNDNTWKIFTVASFLFITIFFILPYLVQVSTYFHERGHRQALDKYGIKNSYQIDLLATIPNFYNPNVDKLGVTRFDLEAYKALDKYKRTEVNIAGIVSDLRFLFLIAVYLTFGNIYLFYRYKFSANFNPNWVLAINWILFMWLLALIQITVSNITYHSGDIYQLVNLLRI
ncbi:MAG: hypothetical protein WC438_02225 [Candidatus Pacearchaeota archaeon]